MCTGVHNGEIADGGVVVGKSKFVQYGANACMCTIPRVHSAQPRHSQPAFIIVMIMKPVSVTSFPINRDDLFVVVCMVECRKKYE